MKLSVAMIVKNEATIIDRCLESVKEADEIVIVDTGSEDNTVEIAKKYTDKVFTDYKWNDNFGEARQHAMDKCTGDWILSIDADDWLSKGGISVLRHTIERHPNQFCFSIKFIAEKGTSSHKLPYLYKNCAEVKWNGAVHNYLNVSAVIDSGAFITFGYSPSHKKDPGRSFRILKKEVAAHPEKPREIFYLAREYRYQKDWVNCLYYCDRYLKFAHWGPEIADAQLMKARALWHLQRGEEARDACLQAIKINTNFREAVLFMAEMTGPINKDRWLLMAEFATNRNVLFTRNKTEKDAAYYEKYNDIEERYTNIYKQVGKMVGPKRCLDVGCGQGKLSEYIEVYDGFDQVKNPYRVADIYTHEFGDYDVYILLEVLEHLLKDTDVLKKVPSGKEIIFSVPSFDDPSHVRMFTEQIVQWRYKDLVRLQSMTRYNFDDKHRKWKTDFPATPSYILLCKGLKI